MTISDALKKINENYTLISLICYGIGFLNTLIFYTFFNIPIIYYTSITDIILLAVAVVIILAVTILPLEFILNNFIILIREKLFRFSPNELVTNLFRIILTALIMVIITKFWKGIVDIPGNLYILLLLAPILISVKSHFSNFSSVSIKLSAFIIFSVLLTFIVGTYDATNKIKIDKLNSREVYFIYNDSTKISTDKKKSLLRYIGETSSHIFIYDRKTTKSFVFEKENISELAYR